MKWILYTLMIAFACPSAIASGVLFNITTMGTPANINTTLCLNGKGLAMQIKIM